MLAVSAKRGKSGKGSSRRWYVQCVVEDHFRDKYLCNTFLIEKISVADGLFCREIDGLFCRS
ncbi:hypothetical protein, partial [Dysosmobacter welbionis]|uniref:hypothetical protein n=1 Tax=Dysosmobacter welbionis TaxID=2093857 RepID=UPI0029420076